MTTSKVLWSLSVALVSMIVLAAPVHAAAVWNINGGGCVPEDPTVEENIHFTVTGGMRVKFRPGKTGTIKLVCPVTEAFQGKVGPIGAGDNFLGLVVYYQDPDGPKEDYRVRAHLRSVRLRDGAYSTLCTADSNEEKSTAQWSRMRCNPDIHLGRGHVYWVQVVIQRQATENVVELNAVELVNIVG